MFQNLFAHSTDHSLAHAGIHLCMQRQTCTQACGGHLGEGGSGCGSEGFLPSLNFALDWPTKFALRLNGPFPL